MRSDGSGTTAQFTAFMARQTPDDLERVLPAGRASTSTRARRCRCGPTSTPPSQQFSDGVADYVAAPYNNGAITYVEYGYAKQRGFPVASVLNKAGYFTQPTAGQRRDRAARRRRSTPTCTQNLQGVYTNPDPRAYPVSSYSYLIVPTTTAAPFTAAKGTTLSKFILYMVCAGQQKAAQLGYSPLPQNLVQDAFNVVQKIPGHVEPAADQPVRQPDDQRDVHHQRHRASAARPTQQGSTRAAGHDAGHEPGLVQRGAHRHPEPDVEQHPAAGGSGAAGAKARRKGALVAVGTCAATGQQLRRRSWRSRPARCGAARSGSAAVAALRRRRWRSRWSRSSAHPR